MRRRLSRGSGQSRARCGDPMKSLRLWVAPLACGFGADGEAPAAGRDRRGSIRLHEAAEILDDLADSDE